MMCVKVKVAATQWVCVMLKKCYGVKGRKPMMSCVVLWMTEQALYVCPSLILL